LIPWDATLKWGSSGSTKISWSTNAAPSAAVYVSENGQPETLFSQSSSNTGLTATGLKVDKSYNFRLYSDTTKATKLSEVIVTTQFDYKVGVDYHATGVNFDNDSFLEHYNESAVRSTVLSQLQAMADRGATFISTRIWLVSTGSTATSTARWKWQFPPSSQEIANLRQYATDVASIVASDGHRLRLDLVTLRLWAADVGVCSSGTTTCTASAPSSCICDLTATNATLGNELLAVSDFKIRWETTYKSVFDAVADITRPDGKKVVDRVYMDGEVMVGAKRNQDWLLKTFYPGFVSYANSKGLTPTLYFIANTAESDILNTSFKDPNYSVLDGRPSMFWMYRSLKYMKDNALPMPSRIDFSNYVRAVTSTYDTLVTKIFDDADATLPSLGLPKSYANAETFYLASDAERKLLGAAMAKQRLVNRRLTQTSFWTTPEGGADGIHVGFPFAFENFLP